MLLINQHQMDPMVILALVVVFGTVSAYGCGGGGKKDPLNWKQAQTILEDPEVTTMRQLFRRLSQLEVEEYEKAYYRDVKAREAEFQSLDNYIDQRYLQPAAIEGGKRRGIDMNPQAVCQRLEDAIRWKNAGASLAEVSRVYTVDTHYPTRAERRLHWDKIVYLKVFADDNGKLLGWVKASEAPEY